MTLPTYSADVSVEAAPRLAEQLQAKTTTWPAAARIAWWLLLLPVALALHSWSRPAGWTRRIGLSAAAVLALLVGVGITADPPPAQTKAATLVSTPKHQPEDAAASRQAAADKEAADAAAAQAAADRQAAEASAAKAAADRAEADRIAADAAATKAAAERAAAAQAVASKAAAAKAAAEKAASDKAAADRAAANQAAAKQQTQAQSSTQQAAAAPAAPTSTSYANCTELRADYPGGVAQPGAVDHRANGGHAKYTPTYSSALYDENSSKDRDNDGIACEA